MLSRDLWLRENDYDESDVVDDTDFESWQLVPTSFEDVCAWASVTRDTTVAEWTRAYQLLYNYPGETALANTIYPVVLQLQGFVKTCNLTPLGSWNGCV